MAVIGDISVSISARTQKFEKGLQDSSKSLDSFVQGVKQTAITVAGLGAALAGAAAAGISYYVKNSMEAIDRTAKLSDRLRITTQDLMGLRHAANLSGVGAEEFDSALQGMVRRIAEAALGSQEAATALESIGLSAQELSGLGAGEAFRQIADGISKIENQSEKSAVATDLFGKKGQELLNVLEGGSAGINAMVAEAERLGLALNRIDAAKVEAALDSFTRLGALLEGAANTLSVQLAPFLEAAVNKMIEFGTAGDGVGSKVVQALGLVLRAVAELSDWFALLEAGWYAFKTAGLGAISIVAQALSDLVGLFDKAYESITGERTDVSRFMEHLADGIVKDTEEAAQKMGEAFDAWAMGTNSQKALEFMEKIQKEADLAAAAIGKAAEEKMNMVQPPIQPPKSKEKDERIVTDVIKGIEAKQFSVGQFRTLDSSRVSVSGLQMGQGTTKVMDPQLKETNAHLKQLVRQGTGNSVAVVG